MKYAKKILGSIIFTAIVYVSFALLGNALMTHAVVAKKLYKYQDEQGQWHFTDTPPKNQSDVQVQNVTITQKRQKINLRNKSTEAQPLFYVINEYHGPVTAIIRFSHAQNVIAKPALPLQVVIPAASEQFVTALSPQYKNRAWSYNVQMQASLGDPRARHQPPKPYRLPFAAGQAFVISQGFHGRYSHRHPQSEYAVDFAMPEGTPIHAARAGRVMDVANDFYASGTDHTYLDRANLIRILHDDGTMAVYAHLKLETVQVALGAAVQEGQFIAESGNTGFSTGPHLHFAIQQNIAMELRSVPFEFDNGHGMGITPVEGMLLQAK